MGFKGRAKDLPIALKDDPQSYILITCNAPDDLGQMAVEVSHKGDPTLLSLLLHDAQTYMEQQES